LKLERYGSRKRLPALANHLQILGVKNARPIILLYNVIESEAGVIQDRPIGIQDRSIRAQYMDEGGDYVRNQRQLFLREPLLCYVLSRADVFQPAIPVSRRVTDQVYVLDRTVRQQQTVMIFKIVGRGSRPFHHVQQQR